MSAAYAPGANCRTTRHNGVHWVTLGNWHEVMVMDTAKVSVRDFRNRFSDYSESGQAVAVTKHGRTIGFYIPVRRKPAAEDLATFREAGRVMQEWMAKIWSKRGCTRGGFQAAEAGQETPWLIGRSCSMQTF